MNGVRLNCFSVLFLTKKMNTPIVLGKFDPSMIAPDDIGVSIGKRRTGKTTGVLDIMYSRRMIPDGVVLCGTADASDSYEQIVPQVFIHDHWNDAVIESAIKRQQALNFERKQQGLPKKMFFLTVDDLGWDDKFCNNRQLKRLLMNGRWWGFALWVVLHHPLGFKPAMRNQFDWIMIHRENMPSQRKRIYDHYAGAIGSYATFCEVLDKATENFGVLVIRNTGTTNKLEDNFMWWKPKIRDWRVNKNQPKWHMGCKSFWAYHYKNYDTKWNCRHDEGSEEEKRKLSRNSKVAPRIKLARK